MNTNKPLFLQLAKEDQKAAIESLIFASEEPLTVDSLFKILIVGNHVNKMAKISNHENGTQKLNGSHQEDSESTELKMNGEANDFLNQELDYEAVAKERWEFSIGLFEELITEINIELINTNRPFQIIKVGNGYQFCTRREYGELIHHLTKGRPKRRFSQAALECLAIIAYRQPVTKPEIDQIRGVTSNEVVNSLVDKNLVEPTVQKETIGRPWMYATTNDFLKAFGLNQLEDLPKLRELDEVVEMLNAENPDKEIVIDVTGNPVEAEEAESTEAEANTIDVDISDPDNLTEN